MNVPWETLGWIGQGCFFSRFAVQWIASEKAGRSRSPRIFWWLSLVGVLLVGAAAVNEREWILVPGYALGCAIYMRNIWFSLKARTAAQFRPVLISSVACLGIIVLLGCGIFGRPEENAVALPWVVAGVLGQLIWGARFIIQWWASERRGESHFPLAFWWASIVGVALNIAYTSQLETPLFLVGYLPAWFVPARNLMLEYKDRARKAESC